MTKKIDLPLDTYQRLLTYAQSYQTHPKNASQGTKVIASIQQMLEQNLNTPLSVALICPNSFNNYERLEAELQKLTPTTILTATSVTQRFAERFVKSHPTCTLYHETRGGKVFNLRKIVQSADRVLLFEYSDRDPNGYSLTQKALAEAQRLGRPLQLIEEKKVLLSINLDKM